MVTYVTCERSILTIFSVFVAVSYTHLDVYKRQVVIHVGRDEHHDHAHRGEQRLLADEVEACLLYTSFPPVSAHARLLSSVLRPGRTQRHSAKKAGLNARCV